jgi:hypothetical protein
MTIVHYEHRYKRPPRKKPQKPAIEGPAVVRARPTGRPENSSQDDADDDRKPVPTSAIVTIRKSGSEVPDMTPEEHQRRGDAAEALFREMKRRIAATTRQGGA